MASGKATAAGGSIQPATGLKLAKRMRRQALHEGGREDPERMLDGGSITSAATPPLATGAIPRTAPCATAARRRLRTRRASRGRFAQLVRREAAPMRRIRARMRPRPRQAPQAGTRRAAVGGRRRPPPQRVLSSRPARSYRPAARARATGFAPTAQHTMSRQGAERAADHDPEQHANPFAPPAPMCWPDAPVHGWSCMARARLFPAPAAPG